MTRATRALPRQRDAEPSATSSPPSSPTSSPTGRPGAAAVPLQVLLDRWVADGLVTPTQAGALAASTDAATGGVVLPAASPRTPHRASLAVEGLGYLGGVLVLAACVSIVGLYWDDTSTWLRLLLVGGAAGALALAGLALPPDRGVTRRLRSVLWVVSTAAATGYLVVLGDQALGWGSEDTFLLAAAGACLWAGVLWAAHRALLQELTVLVATAVLATAVATRLGDSDSLPGFAAWGVAAVWFLLAWTGRAGPHPQAVRAVAAVVAVVAAGGTFPLDAGIVLALATATGVLVVAVVERDLVLLTVGALSLLQLLPAAVSEWFPDTVAAPFAILVVGLVVVAAAVLTSVRGRGGPSPSR